MPIQPTTRNFSEAIIESHPLLSKNSSQEIPDYTTYSVRGENLQKEITISQNFKPSQLFSKEESKKDPIIQNNTGKTHV